MGSDNYKAVLDDLRDKRKTLDGLIAGLEMFAGGSGVPAAGSDVDASPEVTAPAAKVRADSFFGMSVPDAVKKFLDMKKRPQKAKEIADGLEAGGLLSNAKSFYANVSTALRRLEEAGEVVRIGDSKKWALSEWYPGRPKTGKPSRTNGEANAETSGDADRGAEGATSAADEEG